MSTLATSPLEELKTLLYEVNDLRSAAALLHWDQATYMPPEGARARGRQTATLNHLAHEKFVAPRVGELLQELGDLHLPYASNTASLVRVTAREYEKAVRVPASFAARFSAHTAHSYALWCRARPQSDFASLLPVLQQTLELSRELAMFSPYDHIADPLIDASDAGMTVAQIRPLFAQLRQRLVPLVDRVTAQRPVDASFLHRQFGLEQQTEFAREVVTAIGYDWRRGRMDPTHHPFMTKFSLGDTRITVRGREDHATELLFGAIHEAGHALYEQGIEPSFEATPLAEGTSSGVHESQSRLWENLVGRSLPFWNHFYPRFQARFPTQLEGVGLTEFVAAINRVERSLIRVEADELTYNLHVMIRFDLEVALLEGSLEVRDLPEAWNERYRQDLGLVPSNASEGCLQDVHWFGGTIGGAFQGYTLGNILGAQFFAAAERAHPQVREDMTRANFDDLRNWLTQNVYRHGAKFDAAELLQQSTGEAMTIEPYLDYLTAKYSPV